VNLFTRTIRINGLLCVLMEMNTGGFGVVSMIHVYVYTPRFHNNIGMFNNVNIICVHLSSFNINVMLVYLTKQFSNDLCICVIKPIKTQNFIHVFQNWCFVIQIIFWFLLSEMCTACFLCGCHYFQSCRCIMHWGKYSTNR
jgi:hypothetical protein